MNATLVTRRIRGGSVEPADDDLGDPAAALDGVRELAVVLSPGRSGAEEDGGVFLALPPPPVELDVVAEGVPRPPGRVGPTVRVIKLDRLPVRHDHADQSVVAPVNFGFERLAAPLLVSGSGSRPGAGFCEDWTIIPDGRRGMKFSDDFSTGLVAFPLAAPEL